MIVIDIHTWIGIAHGTWIATATEVAQKTHCTLITGVIVRAHAADTAYIAHYALITITVSISWKVEDVLILVNRKTSIGDLLLLFTLGCGSWSWTNIRRVHQQQARTHAKQAGKQNKQNKQNKQVRDEHSGLPWTPLKKQNTSIKTTNPTALNTHTSVVFNDGIQSSPSIKWIEKKLLLSQLQEPTKYVCIWLMNWVFEDQIEETTWCDGVMKSTNTIFSTWAMARACFIRITVGFASIPIIFIKALTCWDWNKDQATKFWVYDLITCDFTSIHHSLWLLAITVP